MKEQLISFETARLAKEKGFEIPTYTAYIDGKFHKNEDEPNGYDGYDLASKENWNKKGWIFTKNGEGCFGCQGNPKYFEAYTVTTQSLLQKWLRDVHNIHIDIHAAQYAWNNKNSYLRSVFKILGKNIQNKYVSYRVKEVESYEEALEKGLQEGLKLI